MEPTAAAWGAPFEFQLAAMNWTAKEAPVGDAQVWAAPAGGLPLEYASIVDIFGGSSCSLQPYAAPVGDAQVWAAPAGGLPLEYASIVDIFGGSSCSLQPYAVPASSSSPSGGQQQLVEYNYYNNYYAAAAQAQHHDLTGKATTTQEVDDNQVKELFQERKKEFNRARRTKMMKSKMHRYPPSIRDLGDWCTVPKVVAIGPYYHHHDKLKPAEEAKHVATHHCSQKSGLSVREMYHAVISAAKDARSLYDKDVMEGIDHENEFQPMMFYDACFLVMYMLKRSSSQKIDGVLFDFFESNDTDIAHDIMLLENQIPWPVVDAIRKKMKSGHFLEEFIANWKDGCLLDRVGDGLPPEFDEDYEPPHLLGLLRFYTVGTRTRKIKVPEKELEKIKSLQISASAMELAEMGIHLTANGTTALPDMGLASKWIFANKWIFFAELFMAPLSLDDSRASLLVNMAALELCTTPDFFEEPKNGEDPKYDDSAVCSYLLLLCMLMHKEDDVHELRKKGILQGGAGLTDKKALDFFTSLQSLRRGRYYAHVMVEIQNYRNKKGWWIKVYAFLYKNWNWKIITGIASAIGGFIAIIKKLESLKGSQ